MAPKGPPTLTAIAVSPASKSIAKGTSLQLSAMGTFSDGSQKNLTSTVTWQTSSSSIAKINAGGNLTGVSPGSTQVSASYQGIAGNASITVGPPALFSIAVSANQSTLPLGESEPLTATGSFSDGSTQDLTQSATWAASPSTVAKISAQGNFTGVGPGSAQASAAYQGITGNASLTVGPPALLSIGVGASHSSLPSGESEPLTATGNFSDGSTQNLTASVTWKATPQAIATITAQGNFTGVSPGSAQVSAAYQGITGSATIAVAAAALTRIAVSASQSSLPLGESESLTATGTFSDGSTQNLTQSATWTVNSTTLAKINAQGNLTGLAQGSVQASATYQGITGSASLTIGSAALMRIAVGASQSSLPLGESEALTATGTFSDGSTQNLTSSVTWQAIPTSVAKINAQGNLTGLGPGSAQVSAVYQAVTGSASVTVGPPALLQIAVSPSQSSLPLGESEAMIATGSFSDGSTKNLTQTAVWSSSGAGIASVSSAGAVVAKGTGAATISATANSVTGNASLTVTPAVIVALNIAPATFSLLIANSSQFQAIGTFSDGTTQNMTKTVRWSAGTPLILNVSSGGLVTGVQVGAGTLLARTTSGPSFSTSASVTVTPLMTVSYFNRANSASSGDDGTLRITNPGFVAGDLCAMIYVFDRNQELNECCGCSVSDSGLLTISLIGDLTANPLTGTAPVAGTIEIVPSEPGSNGQCNAGSPSPNGLLLGWETNVQGTTGAFQMTEAPVALTPLANSEAQVLASDCSMLQQLGSGAGVCTCGTGN
jgi:trimeric autotransporter adhesin